MHCLCLFQFENTFLFVFLIGLIIFKVWDWFFLIVLCLFKLINKLWTNVFLANKANRGSEILKSQVAHLILLSPTSVLKSMRLLIKRNGLKSYLRAKTVNNFCQLLTSKWLVKTKWKDVFLKIPCLMIH